MSLEANIKVVQEYWEQSWNQQRPENLKNTHHVSFSQNGKVFGINAFKESLASFFKSFPDIRISIEDVLAEGERVLMRVTYHGTHQGSYEGIQPTQKKIKVGALELFLLLDGKIIHHWHEMDHLEILKQIGASAIVPDQ